MKLLAYIFLISLFLTTSNSHIWAQSSDLELVKDQLQRLFPAKFDLKNLNNESLQGTVSFAGINNVDLVCTLNNHKLQKIDVTFNDPLGFEIGHLQQICGSLLRERLPHSVHGHTGIQVNQFTLQLQEDGKSIEQFALQLGSKNWTFLDFGTLQMKEVVLDINYNPNTNEKITGQLTGKLQLGDNNTIAISSTLPQKKEDWIVTGNYTNTSNAISIGNLLQTIGGADLAEDILTPSFVGFFSKLSINQFTIETNLYQKIIKVTSGTDAGMLELHVSGKDKGIKGHLAYNPPSDFKFGNLESSLAWLDGINMPLSNIQLIIGNQPMSLGTKRIQPGLGIQSKITLPKEVEQLLSGKGSNIALVGQIQDVKAFSLGVDVNINADLGNGFMMERVGLGLAAKLPQTQFFVDGTMLFPVDDKTKIRFGFKVGAEPTSSSFIAGLNMEAINDNSEAREWQEPFGIPSISIADLGGEIGLNPTTIIKSVGLNGDLRLGKLPTVGKIDKRLKGSVDLLVDIANPLQSTIKASLENATFIKIIEAFEPDVNFSGSIRTALDIGVEKLVLDIQPANGLLDVEGEVKLFGKSASMQVIADKSKGITIKGTMDPILLEVGEIKLLEIKGKELSQPMFGIELSTDPKINIDGSIEILAQKLAGSLVISKTGFLADVEGEMFGGLAMKAKLTGGALDDMKGMSIALEMRQEVLNTVKTEVIAFIKTSAKNSDKEIRKAQAEIEKCKKNANEAEQFFLNVGNEFLGGINEVQGTAAIAGMAITKGVLEAFDVQSIKFAGAANSLEGSLSFSVNAMVLGKQESFNVSISISNKEATAIIDDLAKEIGKELLKSLNFLEGEWNSMKGELNEFAKAFTKEFEKAVADIEKTFEQAATAFEGLAEDLNELWNGETYEAAASTAALATLKPNIRHYSITIHKLVVNQADDGVSPGGVVDGIAGAITGGSSDTKDRTLELYGPITLRLDQQVWAPNGTNAIFWSRNRGNTKNVGTNGTIAINNTKHFYAPSNKKISVSVYSRVWEYDDGAKAAADDKLYGGVKITFGGATGPTDFTITAKEGGDSPSVITIHGTVTAYAMMTKQDIKNAILSDNPTQLKEVIRKGGDLYDKSIQPLHIAVTNNKMKMVQFLLANGFKPTTKDLNTALKNNDYKADLVQRLLVRGAQPDATSLEQVIKKKNIELVALTIKKGSVRPTLRQYDWAIAQKDYQLANFLLNNGVQPTIQQLDNAVNTKDIKAVELVLYKGLKSTVDHINTSIKNKDKALFKLLTTTTKPNQSSLLQAVNNNDVVFFQRVLNENLSVTDPQILQQAIAKNNKEISQLALIHGASPNAGLEYALKNKKEEYILLCLEYGANPSTALIHYTVQKTDLPFATKLIKTYNASGDVLLKEASTADKIEFAKIALNEGKASPKGYIKQYADKGAENWVNLFLDYGANPNLAMNGTIQNQKEELLERLISLGANTKTEGYVSAAINKKSLSMVELLVNNGAPVQDGFSLAIRTDQLAIVKYLLSMGANPAKQITVAACNGQTDMVLLLLSYGGAAQEGIKCAVEQHNLQMVEALLSYGASPKGLLPISAKAGKLEIVKLLVNYGAVAQTGLKTAVNGNHTNIVDFLLENGALPKGLISMPAGKGNVAMVKSLCQYGDNPQDGMLSATQNGHVPVAEVLVQYGADAKAYEYIRAAVVANKGPMVAYLIQQGADVNQLDSKNRSLLHVGADKLNSAAVIRELLAGGGVEHLNLPENELGNTPLHIAVFVKPKKGKNNLETVRLLVEAGANVNAINTKTKNGKTILAYARSNKPTKDYLRSKGALTSSKKARELTD